VVVLTAGDRVTGRQLKEGKGWSTGNVDRSNRFPTVDPKKEKKKRKAKKGRDLTQGDKKGANPPCQRK